MANNVSSLVPSLYPYAGLPTGSPYVTQTGKSPFADVLYASYPLRNIALANTLAQLQGPSFEGAYAAGPMDQLVQQYRQGLLTSAESPGVRGLEYSGLGPTETRGLQKLYAGGAANISGQAATQEDARKRALIQTLQSIAQSDLSSIAAKSGGQLAISGAQNAQSLAQLAAILNTVHGGVNIASLLIGGALGAAGGLGGAGAGAGSTADISAGAASDLGLSSPTLYSGATGGTSALTGALQGAQTGLGYASQFGGGGTVGSFQPQPNYSSLQYGGPAYTTPGGATFPAFGGPVGADYSYQPGGMESMLTSLGRIG